MGNEFFILKKFVDALNGQLQAAKHQIKLQKREIREMKKEIGRLKAGYYSKSGVGQKG